MAEPTAVAALDIYNSSTTQPRLGTEQVDAGKMPGTRLPRRC